MFSIGWKKYFFLDSVLDPIFVIDLKTFKIIFSNNAAKSLKIFKGKKCYEIFNEKNTKEKECLIKKISKTQTNLFFNYCPCWPNLEKSITARPILNKKKRVSAVLVELHEKEEKLSELYNNIERYKKLFEEAADAIFLADAETGILLDCNLAACKLIEREKDEIIGKHQSFLHPQSRITDNGYSPSFIAHVKGDPNKELEEEVITSKGEIKNVLIKASSFYIKGRKYLQGVFHDITKQKILQKEILEAKLAAEQANIAKNEFLANVNHEIRTPLTVIHGLSKLILDSKIDTSKFINQIYKYASQMQRLVNDVIDISKIELGKFEIDKKNIHLKSKLTELIDYAKSISSKKGLDFKFVCNEKIPEYIFSDWGRINQILTNLINNAVKFTETGTIQLQINIEKSISSNEGFLSFIIIDSGQGIPLELQEKGLFTPFSQATTSKKLGGLGIGLALSKKLACALGGDLLLIKSTPNLGSIFKFVFKSEFRGKFDKFDKIKELPEKPNFILDNLKGIKILVVEDTPEIQLLISHFLNKAGSITSISSDGKAAIEILKNSSFDIILMDIYMPVMDGFKTIQAIKEMGIKTPVIALTARTMKEEKDLCLKAGFKDYLPKPFEYSELIEIISRNLVSK